MGGSFSVGELDSAKALLGLPSLLFDTSWLERQGGVEVRWGHLRQLLSRHLGGHKACNRGPESGLCSRREGSPKLLSVGHPRPARDPHDSMQGGGSDASRAQAGLTALREVGSVC